MSKIKSVTVPRSSVKAPIHEVFVCEDGLGWDLAKFKFSHWNYKRATDEHSATYARVEVN